MAPLATPLQVDVRMERCYAVCRRPSGYNLVLLLVLLCFGTAHGFSNPFCDFVNCADGKEVCECSDCAADNCGGDCASDLEGSCSPAISCGSYSAASCELCRAGPDQDFSGAIQCAGDCMRNPGNGVCSKRVSCGGSLEAADCSLCDRGGGREDCNGDCRWQSIGLCELKPQARSGWNWIILMPLTLMMILGCLAYWSYKTFFQGPAQVDPAAWKAMLQDFIDWQPPTCQNKAKLPPSGQWIGSFDEHGEEHEFDCHLKFKKEGSFDGYGADKDGAYVILGKFNGSTGEARWLRTYHTNLVVGHGSVLKHIQENVTVASLGDDALHKICSGSFTGLKFVPDKQTHSNAELHGTYYAMSGPKGQMYLEFKVAEV